jgi:DNA-binding MarR family transcriptional regulator
MAYKKSKYSATANGDLRFRTIDVLVSTQDALCIADIQQSDIILGQQTSQKLTRVLGELIEMGLVVKSKSKAKNRMVYKSVAVMEQQVYEV